MKAEGEVAHDVRTAEHRRPRTALWVLLIGVVVLLGTVGLAMLRTGSSPAAAGLEGSPPAAPEVDEGVSARAATIVLVYGTILLLVFVVAAGVLVAASRSFRRQLMRGRSARNKPTPTDDVWSQHKLPDDAVEPGEPPGDRP